MQRFGAMQGARSNTILLNFLLLLPAATGASSPQVMVKLSPALECSTSLTDRNSHLSQLLVSILPKVASGSLIKVDAGILIELEHLLTESGNPKPAAQYTRRLIDWVIHEHKGQNTILGHTATQLDKFKDAERQLLICVVSGNCNLIYGAAAHLAPKIKFAIAPFIETSGPSQKMGWLNETTELEIPPRMIIVRGGANASPVLATHFFHEATHFADFELISQWIDANIANIDSGGLIDELFIDFYRTNASGEHEIDEGFLRIFLESRAYSAEIAGFGKMMSKRSYDLSQKKQRSLVMKDIRAYPVTRPLVEKLNITEENIFEIGERWGRVMALTIKLSK